MNGIIDIKSIVVQYENGEKKFFSDLQSLEKKYNYNNIYYILECDCLNKYFEQYNYILKGKILKANEWVSHCVELKINKCILYRDRKGNYDFFTYDENGIIGLIGTILPIYFTQGKNIKSITYFYNNREIRQEI